jgi:uncharacterized membrane protein
MARRFLLAVATVVVVAFTVAGGGPRPAGAKTFEITELVTEATVQPDGSMQVRERITYDFSGGTFTVGIRTFEPRSLAQITEFQAAEDGQRLNVIPPSQSISGAWEWEFAPARDERRTFDVSYRVTDAVAVGPDVGELYWKFVGTDHPGIGRVAVDITVPGGFPAATPETPDDDAGVVRAWAHGPRNGVVTVASALVTLRVTGVPSETFVEARVVVPSAAFTVPPSGGPRLPTVLEEERSFQRDLDREDFLRRLGNWAAPATAFLGILAFLGIWWRWGKEPRPPDTIGDYWREPLQDTPAVVTANLAFGTVGGPAFASTVIDLAQRGWITISEQTVERFGPDKTVYSFRWAGKGKEPLLPYERSLLQHLFRGAAEVTSEQFEAWARTNPGTAQTFWSTWKKEVSDDVTTHGYIETGRIAPWLAFITLEMALVLAGVLILGAGSVLFFVPWVVAFGLVFAGHLLRRRTELGAERAAEAEALKRYLKDFSTLDEAPVESIVLWERFLVYAVALGVAADLIRGLAVKVPAVASNAAFAGWYVGSSGRGLDGLSSIDRFSSGFGSGASGALTPSSSGSSGGFSGGGGGGGGGGGFGAR